MITQRFNINRVWDDVEISHRQNIMFMGFTNLLNDLVAHFFTSDKDDYKRMIEIGAYMGESTFLFGCSGIFKEINTIEPHKGKEEFNDMFEYTWDDVKLEFEKNTRHLNNIINNKDFSYNISNQFQDNQYDFVYIDADHTYESVKKDLELYLPKVKNGGIIGGHDYTDNWVEVRQAVDEVFGSPDRKYDDGSWIKVL